MRVAAAFRPLAAARTPWCVSRFTTLRMLVSSYAGVKRADDMEFQ